MSRVHLAELLVYPLFAGIALHVARRMPSHRWVAGFVAWLAATDWISVLLQRVRADAPKPYTGGARILFHIEEFIVISWSFLALALILHHFARGSSWVVVAPWLVAFGICLHYPTVRGDALLLVYRVTAVSTTAISWACIVWAFARRKDLNPDLSHLTVILYAATDVIWVASSWLAPAPLPNWCVVQTSNLVLIAACILAHTWWLVRRRPAVVTA